MKNKLQEFITSMGSRKLGILGFGMWFVHGIFDRLVANPGSELAGAAAMGAVALIVAAYLVGQGLADQGKEAVREDKKKPTVNMTGNVGRL